MSRPKSQAVDSAKFPSVEPRRAASLSRGRLSKRCWRINMGKQKPTDFEKNKLRLGKGRGLKKESVTHTPLTVKTRRIEIGQQSVAAERAPEVTSRLLDLPALVTQLSHYNEHVRQEALAGVAEWSTRYSSQLVRHLGELSAALVERLSDLYNSVRRSLLATLPTVFERVPLSAMAAHVDVWVVHLASALSHTQWPIKVDALRLLELLLRHYSTLLTAHKPHAQLRSALVPLAAQHAPLARSAPDAAALLVRVLDTYLRCLALPVPMPMPMSTESDTHSAPFGLSVALRAHPLAFSSLSSTLVPSPSSSSSNGALSSSSYSSPWSELATPLLELWVEAVAEAQDRTLALAEVAHVASLAALLLRLDLGLDLDLGAHGNTLTLLRKHVFNTFPLSLRCAHNDARSLRHSANASVARLMLAHKVDVDSERVSAYLVTELSAVTAMGRVSDDSALALAPLLDLLVSERVSLLSHSKVLDALFALVRAVAPLSPIRQSLLALTRSVLVDLPRTVVSEQSATEWVLQLTKFLWQLGATSPDLSALALDVLHDALAFGARLDSATLSQALCPLFSVVIPTKKRVVFGPFDSYDAPLKRRLLQVLAFVKPLGPNLIRALSRALSRPLVATQEYRFFLEVIVSNPGFSSVEELLSLWASLLKNLFVRGERSYVDWMARVENNLESLLLALLRSSFQADLPLLRALLPSLDSMLVGQVTLDYLLGLALLVIHAGRFPWFSAELLPLALRVCATLEETLRREPAHSRVLIQLILRLVERVPSALDDFLRRFTAVVNARAPSESDVLILLGLLSIGDARRTPLMQRLIENIRQECPDRLLVGRLLV